MSKKILIIGNTAKVYSLAKFLSEENEVYVAPGSPAISEFATNVDLRENSEILEFVMENGIDLTIPVALNSGIVELFNNNNQKIFAPSNAASKLIYDKNLMKKVLYKLRIPTPKFGIFEKPNMVMDYIKNLKNPFVLKTNEPSSAVVLTSSKEAKTIVDSIFAQQTQKVLIEDYVWGTPFVFYTVTDGYKALPIGSSILYKHSLEGNGGQLTSGMGACAPNYKLSIDHEYFLMDNVIYPTLDYLEIEGNPYTGILGVNGIITENGVLQILGYESFMQDADCAAVLECLDTDLYCLFEACVVGSFSDEFEFIPQKDISATSIVLTCKNKDNKENIINGLELLDEETLVSFAPTVVKNRYLEYEAAFGANIVLTSIASTNTKSAQKVYEEAANIDFNGIYYRKDICRSVIRM